jgi:hypothetical protein
MDAQVVDHQLHSKPPILVAEERVEKAYRSGRDIYVYTTHHVLKVVVQGPRGWKVEYLVNTLDFEQYNCIINSSILI